MESWTLPPSPGPLLWFAYAKPSLLVDEYFRKYTVTRLTKEKLFGLSSYGDVVYPLIYVHGDILPENPLNTLNRLERFATLGGLLVLDLPLLRNEQCNISLRERSLTAMLSSLGWSPLATIDKYVWLTGALVFRKQVNCRRYQLQSVTYTGSIACGALFNRSFNEPVQPGMWEWKYGEGRGLSVIALRGNDVVAHYGAVSRAIRFLGQTIHAIQICDVMVDPSERAIMTKSGAFVNVAKVTQESIIGYGQHHLFAYGFPNRRAMRLGERTGLYEEVERLVELRWLPKRGSPSLRFKLRPVSETESCKHQINQLWVEMADDLSGKIVGVRDAAYLQYRYEAHPVYSYHLFLLKHRWMGEALGLLVLRRDGECCRLIDLVGPLRNMSLMVEYARRVAADWGMNTLEAWITSGQSQWLATPDAEVTPTEICIPGNCHIERVPLAELKNRWWLTMGDTDFL